jgi:phage tail sheath protein FI
MPEYLSPGVYVEEIEIGAKPIEGVSTSTVGFLGETERGPTTPLLVTSWSAFQRLFGGCFSASKYLPYAVDGFFRNGGKRCFIGRILGKNNACSSRELNLIKNNPGEKNKDKDKDKDKKPREDKEEVVTSDVLLVKAAGPGIWGDKISVKIEDAGLSKMNSKLFKMTVIYWDEVPPKPVVDPTDPTKKKDPNRREPKIVEFYDNLSADPNSSYYCEKKINGNSVLIEVECTSTARPKNVGLQDLKNGKDGSAITLSDYKGDASAEPGKKTGLASFGEIDEISIVVAPNENDINGLTGAVIEHCELMKDRFAIIQTAENADPIGNLVPPTDSKYAAIYYPWIKVIDPVTNINKKVPPGGHMAGVYARSDTERGVHKAPANEKIRGVTGLQFPITKGDQEILNPRGINCIRAFRGRGIRVWGARTISSDSLWKYINVRRLFLFLEESIEEGTQWVVFEPNDEKLWARVKQTISQFLTGVWKSGALMGTTAEEAFFVKCDRTTMTQDDIDNGRLIVLIGVAPVKPAEFVIFRIAQWQGGSEVSD